MWSERASCFRRVIRMDDDPWKGKISCGRSVLIIKYFTQNSYNLSERSFQNRRVCCIVRIRRPHIFQGCLFTSGATIIRAKPPLLTHTKAQELSNSRKYCIHTTHSFAPLPSLMSSAPAPAIHSLPVSTTLVWKITIFPSLHISVLSVCPGITVPANLTLIFLKGPYV